MEQGKLHCVRQVILDLLVDLHLVDIIFAAFGNGELHVLNRMGGETFWSSLSTDNDSACSPLLPLVPTMPLNPEVFDDLYPLLAFAPFQRFHATVSLFHAQ